MTTVVVKYLQSIGWLVFPHTQKWDKNSLTEAANLNSIVSASRLAQDNNNSDNGLQHGK